jgi:AcrR family transcriptional regulator
MREQLLDAARDVLREKGIMGATTREIARAAGCADGTLYNHFRTREDLFLALFERTLPQFRQALAELPLRVGQRNVRSNLEEVLVSGLGFFREVVPIFAAVLSDPALNAGYRARLGAQGRGPHRAYAWFETYLQAEQRINRIGSAVDPTATAQQLVAIAFFQAFTERFLGTTPTAAADRRWVSAQVGALIASWAPDRPARRPP